MDKCPECGRETPTERGLAVHRALKHGVAGKFAKRQRKAATGRNSTHKAHRTYGLHGSDGAVGQAFDGLAGMMDAHAQIVTQCLDGLDRLLGKAKDLRKAYIRNADRLRKIGADTAAFSGEE